MAVSGVPSEAPDGFDNLSVKARVPENGVAFRIGIAIVLGAPSPLAQLSAPYVLP
jgi:hypothetical protein